MLAATGAAAGGADDEPNDLLATPMTSCVNRNTSAQNRRKFPSSAKLIYFGHVASWQRKEWRFAVTTRVDVEIDGKFVTYYTINLSLGGLMIRGPKTLSGDVGIKLHLDDKPVTMRARVLASAEGTDHRTNVQFLDPTFEATEAIRDYCRDKLVPKLEKALEAVFPGAHNLVSTANEFARLQPGKSVDVVEVGFGTTPDPKKFERAALALRDAMLLIEQLHAAIEASNEMRDYSPFPGDVAELASMVRAFRAFSERELQSLQNNASGEGERAQLDEERAQLKQDREALEQERSRLNADVEAMRQMTLQLQAERAVRTALESRVAELEMDTKLLEASVRQSALELDQLKAKGS